MTMHHQTPLDVGTRNGHNLCSYEPVPFAKAQSWHRELFEGSMGCLCHFNRGRLSPNSHSYGFIVSDIHLLPFKLNCMRLETEKTMHYPGIWYVRREGNFLHISSIRAQKAAYSSEETTKMVSRSH